MGLGAKHGVATDAMKDVKEAMEAAAALEKDVREAVMKVLTDEQKEQLKKQAESKPKKEDKKPQ